MKRCGASSSRHARGSRRTVSGAATIHSLPKFATLSRGALSSVKVAGSLFDKHVLEYYSQSIKDIRQKGLYRSLAETSEPYIAAVWYNFQTTKPTLTQYVLSGEAFSNTWQVLRRFIKRDVKAPSDSSPASPS